MRGWSNSLAIWLLKWIFASIKLFFSYLLGIDVRVYKLLYTRVFLHSILNIADTYITKI